MTGNTELSGSWLALGVNGPGIALHFDVIPVQELKNRTRDLHERIETVVPLLDPGLTPERYFAYLGRLLPFYQRVEQHLRAVPNLRAVVPDIDDRWKSRLLAADIGKNPGPFDSDAELSGVPQPRAVPEALGCLYVLEGSTLGAQILVRAVRGGLKEAVAGRTRFLESYGAAVGEKWRGLCAILNAALTDPEDLETAVVWAQRMFTSLHNRMAGSAGEEAMAQMQARESLTTPLSSMAR